MPKNNPPAFVPAANPMQQVMALISAGQMAQAIGLLVQLVNQQPGNAALWFNLGQALSQVQDWPQSLKAFDRGLSLMPNEAQALAARAQVWAALGEHSNAGRDATRALAIKPDLLTALTIQANSLLVVRALAHALQSYLRLEQLRPGGPFVACTALHVARMLCHWQPLGLPLLPAEASAAAQGHVWRDLDLLYARAMRGEPAIEPFAALSLYDDAALHRRLTRQWLAHLHPAVAMPATAAAPRDATAGLKVAYVSCDFHEHATAYLLAGVLEAHAQRRSEPGAVPLHVVLISYSPAKVGDAMQARLQASGHTWLDAHTWSDARVAQWCRDNGVQIAVDLKGLTRDSREGIFAHRSAPVQVNWLGYPGTLDAPYYDYMLADQHVVPAAQRAHYAEAMAYLPHSYQPNDRHRPLMQEGVAPPTRESEGLAPEGGLVLCCFNNSFKITPDVFALWCRLLLATPGSVLWLLEASAQSASNLRATAQSLGVNPERLVFAPTRPLAAHLARLALADLSLETLPYNAHTTASDALWAGVPHLTCVGQSFAARVGASLLHAVELPQLVTHSLAEYEARALALLHDAHERQALRAHLRDKRMQLPLFDTQAFTRHLEAAFVQMWQRHTSGQAPADFAVAPSDT